MTDAATPTSRYIRQCRTLEFNSSLNRAAQVLRSTGYPIVPIVKDGKYIGVVAESTFANPGIESLDLNASSETACTVSGTALGNSPVSDCQERFFAGESVLVVLDADQRVLGLLFPSDVINRAPMRPMLPAVGGMATPVGVYMTTAGIRAGVSRWGLLLAGATLTAMVACCRITTELFAHFALHSFGANSEMVSEGLALVSLVLAGLIFRASPLAGIHAAEHMTIHAIENGEELIPDIVRRMPRVHPRCGTNLTAAVLIFSFIGFTDFGLSPDWLPIQLLLAALVTYFSWRRVGSALQFFVTTKTPTTKHIEMGIKSGNELIEKYQWSNHSRASRLKVLGASGLIEVLAGGWLTLAIFLAVLKLLGLGWAIWL